MPTSVIFLRKNSMLMEVNNTHARLKFYKENQKRVKRCLDIGKVVNFEVGGKIPGCSYTTEDLIQD